MKLMPGKYFNPNILGVDHDNKSIDALITSLKIAKELGAVEIFKSPRRKGFHFIVHLTKPVGIEENYRLRMMLGDDQRRLDAELPEVNDFLFSSRLSNGMVYHREAISEKEFIYMITGGYYERLGNADTGDARDTEDLRDGGKGWEPQLPVGEGAVGAAGR